VFLGLRGAPAAGPVGVFGLPVPGLVEGVVGNGLRLGGIERRGLIEVVWGGVGGENLICHEVTGLSRFGERRRRCGIGYLLWGGVSFPR